MATALTDNCEPNLSRRHWPSSLWLAPLALCVVGALCLPIDLPVAEYVRSGRAPKLLREILDNAEAFGHAGGVALILLAMVVLDPARKRWIVALLAGAFGGGLAADLIKLFMSRTRPRSFDFALGSVWDTFGPWFPLAHGSAGDSHSFPSAHTAMATGFAVILAAIYPHGRWLFFTYAALTGLQRIHSSAHFPSDVCVGAAVGWIVGHAALRLRPDGGRDAVSASLPDRHP
jgi:membrane-associated phospholipid phosphatase